MERNYTYQLRLFPTEEQKVLLAKHFGATRWLYNSFIDKHESFYKNAKENNLPQKYLSYSASSKELTEIKAQPETEWLNECNSQSLQHTLKHLDTAFQRFFKKKSQYPSYKSVRAKQAFKVPQFVKIIENKIYFPKFNDGIKLDQHRVVEGKIQNVTVIKNCAGQHFACICVVRNIEPSPKLNKIVGIDLGVKTLVTGSDGVKFENIKSLKKLQKQLRRRQKAVSRAKSKSKGKRKASLKAGKTQVKIRNVRQNHLHKISSKLVNENQVIIMEDLSVKRMMKDHKLAKSIGDCAWSELVRQICYKSEWAGRTVVKIGKYFPSSKMCSECGYIKDDLELKDREWDCPVCGVTHDRDLNAAYNILNEGLNLTAGTAELADCPGVRLTSGKQLVGSETHLL